VVIITFTVPGVPVAQPRVKATRRGNHAGVYTPTKKANGRSNGIAEWKAMVRKCAADEYQGAPLDGPICVGACFVFPRQKSCVWKTREMPRYFHVVKPDADNLFKALADALNGMLWRDDSQVCMADITKVHATFDEQPCCVVSVGIPDIALGWSNLFIKRHESAKGASDE